MARGPQLSNKTVMVWLGIFLIAALALRIGGNIEASYDEETGRYLYSGNDPYYHDRIVNHILDNGESLLFDPAINFPEGGPNPNPPIFSWTSALDAKILTLFGMEQETAVGLGLNLSVAFWGALTVIPVYLIGAELFSRRAGLWGAFFMAVSAPHIQRGVFGFADHDATTMFFITLALAFVVKGVKSLDDREYVPSWRESSALLTGLKASFAHNKQAMLWSALAGTALSATALTWKGYPYVLAVLAVAVGLHLISDHLKNKDSTAVWAFYLLPLLMVTVIPMLYYGAFPMFLDTTIMAGIYVLIGVLVVGAILVPTRDMPSIVVFPALAITAILGLIVMLLLVPAVGQTIFTGLGYFEQTKLYTTIAEAQRSELGRVAASFGFFSFLIAFGGLWKSIRKAWKGDGAQILMTSWALVALFMAFAASRFVMNAAPVFAILAGAMMPLFVDWLKPEVVRKKFRQQHGQNVVKAGFKSLNTRAVLGGLAVAMFFVLPNAWIGVDAALPREFELENGLADDDPNTVERLGAFGIDFGIKNNGWLQVLGDLSELDQDLPMEERPGFIAWWDYGHWATSLGKHPTVADPFQNHFSLAGRFLASETEQEGMAWLSILLIQGNAEKNDGLTPEMTAAVNTFDSRLAEIANKGPIGSMRILEEAIDLEGDQVFDLYDALSDAGSTVSYFAVDNRMYPFSANNPGIFYAPSFLADKNPDDFVPQRYVGSGLSLDVQIYGVDEDGRSYRLPETKYVTSSGAEYELHPGPVALPKGVTPSQTNPGTPVELQLTPAPAFYDTMYARAFGHQLNGFVPGDGLTHWRVISQADNQVVELLEYFRGVPVSGTVRDDAGQPLEGVDVTFVDGFGASHDVATTDAQGLFTVMAPFSLDGDLTLEARQGNNVLANSTAFQFTREEAKAGQPVTGAALVVERSDLTGVVYQDVDGDGAFGENDTALAGALVTYNGISVNTGSDGSYTFTDVQPGSHPLLVNLPGFTNVTTTHVLGAGVDASRDVAMAPLPSDVTFTLGEFNGAGFASIPFTVTAGDFSRQLTTDADGMATTTLAPGTYDIDLSYTVTEDGQSVTYTADWTGVVPFGGEPVDFNVVVNRA